MKDETILTIRKTAGGITVWSMTIPIDQKTQEKIMKLIKGGKDGKSVK